MITFDVLVSRKAALNTLTRNKSNLKEILCAALIDLYDCAYSGLYGAHESFMIDMFGAYLSAGGSYVIDRYDEGERHRTTPLILIKDFLANKCKEYDELVFTDFRSAYNLIEGDVEIWLRSQCGQWLIIDWSRRIGPIRVYWNN